MSDDHLTDHEWRMKQAAEGKAIYSPGKSVEETRAALGLDQRETGPLDALDVEDLCAKVDDMQSLLMQAADVLDLIQHAELDERHLSAVAHLASIALEREAMGTGNDAAHMAIRLRHFFGGDATGGGDEAQ